jgi:hypothetical protein
VYQVVVLYVKLALEKVIQLPATFFPKYQVLPLFKISA